MFKKLGKNIHVLILLAILLFAFLTRIYRVENPSKYYFDEVYHAVTAKLYARNDPSGYEWWHPAPEPNTAIEWLHPPFAKIMQAFGILVFGENSYGWRISSVIFGTAVIFLIYLLAKKLTKSENAALLAAGFASLDGLLLAQSRIAMNDIHVTFFILLTCILYLQWKEKKTHILLLLSGGAIGFALASKWSGIFMIGVLGADQLLTWIRNKKLPSVDLLIRMFLSWIFIPLIVYLLSFIQFWLQEHTLDQFRELHNQIIYYQTHLDATHPFQSRPWQWALDLRPVWMHVDYEHVGKVGNIYNLGNPFIFIAGLLAIIYFLYSFLFKKSDKKNKNVLQFIIIAYALVWMPWFFSPRIMFFYHYTPAVPFLCIALAIGTNKILLQKNWMLFGIGIILLTVLWFVFFFPYLTGIPIETDFVHSVYQFIPSWK